ncbi:MAG: hypothetical protein D6689_02580 [Deltaproteobacteria bacterium]|nr:MAG: hypothetical protein D6689_02580 [Deltaproteobacteria bacterium]
MQYKVLCPIEKKGGGTFWVRTGSAWENRDGSINVELNVLPTNGRLHIRELDERDRARGGAATDDGAPAAKRDIPF